MLKSSRPEESNKSRGQGKNWGPSICALSPRGKQKKGGSKLPNFFSSMLLVLERPEIVLIRSRSVNDSQQEMSAVTTLPDRQTDRQIGQTDRNTERKSEIKGVNRSAMAHCISQPAMRTHFFYYPKMHLLPAIVVIPSHYFLDYLNLSSPWSSSVAWPESVVILGSQIAPIALFTSRSEPSICQNWGFEIVEGSVGRGSPICPLARMCKKKHTGLLLKWAKSFYSSIREGCNIL